MALSSREIHAAKPHPLDEFRRLIDYSAQHYVPLEKLSDTALEVGDEVNRAHAAMVINLSDAGLSPRDTDTVLNLIERVHAHQIYGHIMADLDHLDGGES